MKTEDALLDRARSVATRLRAMFHGLRPQATHVDTDFLPAALEVLESPPSPIGRAIIWIVVIAALFALGWAFLARVDVVAVADGRVIPRARLQSVEAPEAGVVRAIHVVEGQRVAKDEPLLALDPTFAGADAASARTEFAAAGLARARAAALLAFAAGQAPRFSPPEDADPAAAAAEAEAVRARIAGLEARLAGIDQRIAGAEAEIDRAHAERLKAIETEPLVRQQWEGRRALLEKGLAPKTQVLALEERLVTLRREAEARSAEIDQANAEIAMLRRERAQAREEFRAQAAAEKAEAESIVATRAESVKKAITREGYQTLLSPVDGIVNEISVTTLGEVAEAGAPLVTIVPAGEELIVEARVLNRDAGFVREGQPVIVKLEAYPFTRHGYLEGQVEQISPDAVVDEARGLVFPVRVKITKSSLRSLETRWRTPEASGSVAQIEARRDASMGDAGDHAQSGRTVADGDRDAVRADPAFARLLSPGMAAQAEIVTGRRRVIDYVLSPIARATSEAGRER